MAPLHGEMLNQPTQVLKVMGIISIYISSEMTYLRVTAHHARAHFFPHLFPGSLRHILTSWINYTSTLDEPINDVVDDVMDGERLCKLVEGLANVKITGVHQKPRVDAGRLLLLLLLLLWWCDVTRVFVVRRVRCGVMCKGLCLSEYSYWHYFCIVISISQQLLSCT